MTDDRSVWRELHDAAIAARREILHDGVAWFVYELPPDSYDRRATGSLVFESEFTIRRVRNYPRHWRTLSDAALMSVSWNR